MKTRSQHIYFAVRVVSFAIVLTAMVVQPVLKSSGFLDMFHIELASIDFDEDTNEQETQEEENTLEEIELQLHSLTDYSFESAERGLIYGASLQESGFSLENHLPPPEQPS